MSQKEVNRLQVIQRTASCQKSHPSWLSFGETLTPKRVTSTLSLMVT